ncbi:sensor histidine kinase [Trinickia sp. NRRL B-1857]|uniref:sensor histidine kinase n=1 Tax=Trinickia sp. NRRL B-1857 TaxID=3162879 RepID=UPI003D29D0FF
MNTASHARHHERDLTWFCKIAVLLKSNGWTISNFLRVMLLCWIAHVPASAAVRLPDSGRVDLEQWALLRDPASALTVDQLSKPEVSAAFQERHAAPALGYAKGTVWLRITVIRPVQSSPVWLLDLRSPLLKDVTLYLPRQDAGYQEHGVANTQPFVQRDIAYREPLFRIDLPPDQPVTLYLRIRSHSTMSFSMVMWSPEVFISAMSSESLLFGLFFAAHAVLLISSIWLYRVTRNPSFGLFGLSVLVNLFTSLGAEGYLYQYLLPGSPSASDAIYLWSWLLGTPAGTLFAADYLGLFELPYRRKTVAFCWVTLAAAVLAAPWMLVFNVWWVRPLYMLWQLAVLMITLSVVIWLVSRGQKPARVFLFVLILLLGGTALRVARNVGWVAPGLLVDNATYLGMLAFMLIMNSAISWRYTDMRAEKEAAQAEALRVALQAERDLEAKVALRTQALREAMEQVEESLALERRAQDEQRQFLATVSHELRTPLAVIDATAQNLDLDDSRRDPLTSARYQKILRATQRLAVLVNDSLHEDGFELLRRGFRATPTELVPVLQDAAAAASLLSEGHHLEVEAHDLEGAFLCDASLLRLVLRTLADNAVKYTPRGTHVVLRGRRVERGVELEVEDNGPGIAEADLPHVFERFYRGQNVGQKPGTGLGLPLALRMIEMQGGSLSLDSAPGRGCRARIFLPSDVQVSASGSANV